MIFYFPDILKADTDVESPALDWSLLLPSLDDELTVVSHSVSAILGDVVAQDIGMEGLVQTVRLSAGSRCSHSDVVARVVLSDGTDLSRAFRVIVR